MPTPVRSYGYIAVAIAAGLTSGIENTTGILLFHLSLYERRRRRRRRKKKNEQTHLNASTKRASESEREKNIPKSLFKVSKIFKWIYAVCSCRNFFLVISTFIYTQLESDFLDRSTFNCCCCLLDSNSYMKNNSRTRLPACLSVALVEEAFTHAWIRRTATTTASTACIYNNIEQLIRKRAFASFPFQTFFWRNKKKRTKWGERRPEEWSGRLYHEDQQCAWVTCHGQWRGTWWTGDAIASLTTNRQSSKRPIDPFMSTQWTTRRNQNHLPSNSTMKSANINGEKNEEVLLSLTNC